MTFDHAKEIAAVINGAGDQIFNLAILTIAGVAAFVIKYSNRVTRAAWVWLAFGIILIVSAAICSLVIKGLLITILQTLAEEKTPPVKLDDLNMFASFELGSMLLGFIFLAVAVFLSFRRQQFAETTPSPPVGQPAQTPATQSEQRA